MDVIEVVLTIVKDTRIYTESCGGAGAIGRVVCFSATLAGVGPCLLGFTAFTAEGNLQNYIKKISTKTNDYQPLTGM